MPERTRLIGKCALAALLLLLAAAGTRAAWPAVRTSWPDGARLAITGAVLEVALAGLLIALRWRRPAPAQTDADSRAQEDLATRMHRILNGALVTGLAAVPVLVALTELKIKPRKHLIPPQPSAKVPKRYRTPLLKPTHVGTFNFPPLLLDLVIVAIVAALIALALLAWRHRARQKTTGVPALEAELTEEDLARAVESGRAALLEFDDARLSIIRCYLAMEQSLADAGTVRGIAETPDELLARSVAAGLVHHVPASRLTSLFYEARFSTHPMAPATRDQARNALAELAAVLPARSG